MAQYEVADVEKMVTDGNIDGLLQAVDAMQSVDVRKMALEALGETRDKRAEKALRGALSDPEKMISSAAVAALLRYSLANASSKKRAPTAGDPFTFNREKVFTFVIGAIVVGVCLAVMTFAVSSGDSDSPLTLIGFGVPPFIILLLALAGWDWTPRNNPYAYQARVLVLVFIAMTGIGLVPISYWVGKGVMRKLFRL